MTVKGGTTPACASCKYQRRKCSQNCPLAPYFPANQPKMFESVHRLFGVSNVTKILEKLTTKDQKDEAMISIIYEAEMRQRFPVHGCCEILVHLRHQLQFAIEELRHVKAQLQHYREQPDRSTDCWPPLPQFQLGATSGKEVLPYGIDSQFCLNDCNGFSPENMVKPLLTVDDHRYNLTAMQAQMDSFGFQGGNMGGLHEDFEVICHDNYMTSSETSSLEDATQMEAAVVEPGCRRGLKTAAAGFSFTSVN